MIFWTYTFPSVRPIIYLHCLSLLQVEFPEARIYEETLNVLLYENRDKGPDQELMQATRGYTVGVNGYQSDEETDDKDRRGRRK